MRRFYSFPRFGAVEVPSDPLMLNQLSPNDLSVPLLLVAIPATLPATVEPPSVTNVVGPLATTALIPELEIVSFTNATERGLLPAGPKQKTPN